MQSGPAAEPSTISCSHRRPTAIERTRVLRVSARMGRTSSVLLDTMMSRRRRACTRFQLIVNAGGLGDELISIFRWAWRGDSRLAGGSLDEHAAPVRTQRLRVVDHPAA